MELVLISKDQHLRKLLTNKMLHIFLFMAAVLSTSAGIAMTLLPQILHIAHEKRLFDMPDKRKVHNVPIPRLGGLAFFPVVVITTGVAILAYNIMGYPDEAMRGTVPLELLAMLVGCMVLFLVGTADDLVGVGYKKKFVAQIIASISLVASGVWTRTADGLLGIQAIPAWIGMPLTVLLVVYVTNAINLIDGIDGLASGLCAIALAVITTLYLKWHFEVYAVLTVAAVGVIIPFWMYNVFGNAEKETKIYMGDAGSMVLGYLLSFLIVRLSMIDYHTYTAHATSCNNMMLAATTMIVPLLDVVRVVAIRLLSGRNPFLPDKSHIHHMLLRCHMSMRQAMFTIFGLSMLFIAVNFALNGRMDINIILAADLAIWIVFHIIVRYWAIKQK